ARGDMSPAATHVSCSGRADVWGVWRTRRGETAKDEVLSTCVTRLVERRRTRSLPEPVHGALEALGEGRPSLPPECVARGTRVGHPDAGVPHPVAHLAPARLRCDAEDSAGDRDHLPE